MDTLKTRDKGGRRLKIKHFTRFGEKHKKNQKKSIQIFQFPQKVLPIAPPGGACVKKGNGP